MKTNLLEAAAEILNKSKSSAVPAMPMPEIDAEYDDVNDLGGDTPQKHAENNPDYGKAVKKAAAPGAAPKVGAMPPAKLKEEKTEDEDEENEDEEMENEKENKKSMKEDIDAVLQGENLSEDFRNKAATLFEARVHDRVTQIQEELEASYEAALNEAVQQFTVSMTEKVNDYLNYVVQEWMEENAIAIEKGLRTELTEDFIVGLRNLFAENYISIPDEEVDLVEELSEKVDQLTNELNEQINIGIELVKELNESKKNEVFYTVTEGLIQTQIEKMKTLAESVEFSTEEEYKEKLETIRENYFPSHGKVKRADEALLHEAVEDEAVTPKITDARMAAYAQSISRTIIK